MDLCGVYFGCENAIVMMAWYGESVPKAFHIVMRWLLPSLACFVLVCLPSGSVAQTPPSNPLRAETGRPQPCAPVSNREYGPVQLTHRRVMGDRYMWLNEADAGWRVSGVPLVGYLDGKAVPVPCGDDTGLYYIVPLLARTTRRSIDFSIDFFLLGALFASALIGLAGLWAGTQKAWKRGFAVLVVAFATYVAFKLGDVYIMQAASVLAVIPWALQLFLNNKSFRILEIFLFVTGVYLGLAHWVRTHSGTSVILFLLVLILAASLKPKRKVILVAMLALGFMIPAIYSHVVVYQRDMYLSSREPNYHPQTTHHVFWHTVYVGLGYLNNPYVAGWHDVVGAEAVAAVAPHVIYASPEYDSILRQRVLQIFHRDPRFVLYTYSAKFGVVLVMLLIAANLGIIASILYPKGLALELAFWLSMTFGVIPGLIGIPVPQYVSGMIALAILYNYVSVCYAVDQLSRRSHKRLVSTTISTHQQQRAV